VRNENSSKALYAACLSWRTALNRFINFKFPYELLVLLFFLSSCSFVESTRRHLLGEGRAKKNEVPQKHVSQPVEENQQPVQIGQNANDSSMNTVSVEPIQTTPSVNNSAPEMADPNSVWLFDNRVSDEKMEGDLETLKVALELYSKKQWDASMGQLRTLVQSKNDQVQVRARFYAGKILQYKNKHPLALQVFEQIIEQNGYSSLALLSVKEASFSAKVAQLKDKEIFYQTSLEDLNKQAQIP
jgi:hypothetical protein